MPAGAPRQRVTHRPAPRSTPARRARTRRARDGGERAVAPFEQCAHAERGTPDVGRQLGDRIDGSGAVGRARDEHDGVERGRDLVAEPRRAATRTPASSTSVSNRLSASAGPLACTVESEPS